MPTSIAKYPELPRFEDHLPVANALKGRIVSAIPVIAKDAKTFLVIFM